MQLNFQIMAVLLILLLPLSGQDKKIGGPQSAKKKNEIVFSNDQNTQDYLQMSMKKGHRIIINSKHFTVSVLMRYIMPKLKTSTR